MHTYNHKRRELLLASPQVAHFRKYPEILIMDPYTTSSLAIIFIQLLRFLYLLLPFRLIPGAAVAKHPCPENVPHVAQEQDKYRDPFGNDVKNIEGCLFSRCIL